MNRLVLVIALFAATMLNANAYDFSAVSPSGHTLYYKTDAANGGVMVTYYSRPYGNNRGYSNITGNVIIPSSVTNAGITYMVTALGDSVFRNCSGLISVSMPETIKRIGTDAFRGCSGLISMVIPDSVTTIGVAAFQYCSGITEITIGKSVTAIGQYAVEGMNNLTRTNYTGTIADWCNIDFSGWSNPMIFSGGFYMNNVLVTELVIPEGITEIKYDAFETDTVLTSVTFPSTLSTIGVRAFVSCVNLRTFRFKSPNPPSIGNNALLYVPSDKVFYVPCQYYQNYVNVWGNSYNIVCYEPLQFDVTINTNDSTWGTGSYTAIGDSIVKVTATANYGYHFDHWGYGSTANPDTLLLSSDVTVTAIFAKNQYSVTGTANDGTKGTVTGSATVDYLDSVTLTATANYGYRFLRWSDYLTENPRTVAATGDINLTAVFDFNQYNITLSADTSIHGNVSGAGEYNYLSQRTISANANYGYHFAAWSDGVTDNPRTFTLTQDTAFVAMFVNNQYTMTVLSGDTTIGTVTGGGMYDYLDTAILTATAVEHYHFVRWSDGNTTNPRRMVVTSDLTRTAVFGIDTHSVSLQADNITHGTFSGNGKHQYGTAATVEAIPYSGYQFSHWSNGATYNPYTFAVVNDVQLTAYFYGVGIPYQDTIVVYDTALVEIHDTTVVTDTLTLTEYVPVHDTTYINVYDTTYIDVPYAVHDTTVVTDTVTLTEYVPVHDTTYIDVHDTTYINVPYEVHDTTIVTDTVTLTEYVPVHDTTYINVHDTTYIDVPYEVHDTTIITDTVTLTEYVPVHDTTYITLTDTLTVTQYDTIINTVYDTVTNTIFDTVTNTVYDTITNTVFDTIDNYIFDTLTVTDTLWLTQYDTIIIHDTIIIYDTVYITQEGVEGVDALNAKVYSSQGQIVVEGADGNEVTLFDVSGRIIQAIRQSNNQTIQFDAPASGTYMIKIGKHPARKVVVIR